MEVKEVFCTWDSLVLLSTNQYWELLRGDE